MRSRRFLTAAIFAFVVVGAIGAAAGLGAPSGGGGTTTVQGDTSCGYSGTSQFTESTVMKWGQINGTGSNATFSAYANDENSTILGVNTPAASMNTSSPQHLVNANAGDKTQHDGITLTGGEQARPYYPALYISPVSGPGAWTKPGDSIPTAAGDWQQGGSLQDISNGSNAGSVPSGTPYVNDVFGVWVVGTQSTNPGPAPGLVGSLSGAGLPLSTTANTTSLPISGGLTKAVTSGDSLTLSQSGHTQNFKATASAAAGATSITVQGQKANFAYTNGTTVTDTTAQTGNYARQASLPTQNTTASTWNLGSGSDAPVGTTFAAMGSEGYGTEFRWNVSGLTDYQGNTLAPGHWYKIQIVEHDGDQNKGGDSGEFPDPDVPRLTPREGEVLELLAEGRRQKEIAHELSISPKTVGTHVQNLLSKFEVHSRAELVARAYRENLAGSAAK